MSAFDFMRPASVVAPRALSATLSATPVTYSLRRIGSDLVVFCFANPEDSEVFAKHFGGERLKTGSRR